MEAPNSYRSQVPWQYHYLETYNFQDHFVHCGGSFTDGKVFIWRVLTRCLLTASKAFKLGKELASVTIVSWVLKTPCTYLSELYHSWTLVR